MVCVHIQMCSLASFLTLGPCDPQPSWSRLAFIGCLPAGVMPKRGLDVSSCEIFRFYKLITTKSLIEPVSMIVPRRVRVAVVSAGEVGNPFWRRQSLVPGACAPGAATGKRMAAYLKGRRSFSWSLWSHWELGVLTLVPSLLLSCCVTSGTFLCSLGLDFLNSRVEEGLDPQLSKSSTCPGGIPCHPSSHCPDFSCSQNPTKKTSTHPRQGPSPL